MDEWRDYDENTVPFERLEKVYAPDDGSLEQRKIIFYGQLYRDIQLKRLSA